MKHIYRYTFLLLFLCLMGTEQAIAQYNKHAVPCNAVRSDQGSVLLAGRRPMNISIGDCDFPDPPGGGDDDGTGKTEEPFEYDINFGNINELIYLESLLSALTDRIESEWLSEQEETFRKEINDMFNKNHLNFKDAQKDFFQRFENDAYKFDEAVRAEHDHWKDEAWRKDNTQKTYTTELYHAGEWEGLYDWCKDWEGADCNKFGSKRIQGRYFRDIVTKSQLDHYQGLADDDFADMEFNAALERSWATGITRMEQDGGFLDGVINARIGHYGDMGRRERVFLMTNYILTYNHTRYAPMATPSPNYNIPPYWDDRTILAEGKKFAPAPNIEALVFSDDYIRDRRTNCERGNASVPPRYGGGQEDCDAVVDDLMDIRETVIREHINESVVEDLQIKNQITRPCVAEIVNDVNTMDNEVALAMYEAFEMKATAYDLVYTNKPLPETPEGIPLGRTIPTAGYNDRIDGMEIVLNENILHMMSDIAIFSVVLHENMHALMYYQLDKGADGFMFQDNEFLTVTADQWSRAVALKNSDNQIGTEELNFAMHEIISELVDYSAVVLRNYADQKGYYVGELQSEAIVWMGLKDSIAWSELEEEERRRYQELFTYDLIGFEALSIGKKCD